MTKLQEIEQAVAELSSSERAHLLQTVAASIGDQSAGVESRPDVCGGEACIVRTRIPIWVLEQARRLGATEAQLLSAYPTLRAADLVNAWNYVRDHLVQIEADIRTNEES
jgi:uncharacterized protein (DUF433 family)